MIKPSNDTEPAAETRTKLFWTYAAARAPGQSRTKRPDMM